MPSSASLLAVTITASVASSAERATDVRRLKNLEAFGRGVPPSHHREGPSKLASSPADCMDTPRSEESGCFGGKRGGLVSLLSQTSGVDRSFAPGRHLED